MTKLEILKKEIGYTKEKRECQNCEYFAFDVVPLEWNPKYTAEKNIRCTKYNFVTKKTTICNDHKKKGE